MLVVDDTTLGPATGGVRTRAYPSEGEAVADARGLAQAMTIKCAAAGLDAGGGKIVVWRHGPDRQAAFVELGRRVEALGGGLLTAGDLGTTDEDLRAMARSTRFVHTGGRRLLAAAGRAMLRSVQACADVRGRAVGDLHVAIQGCGDIGTAAARALRAAGARVTVADLDAERAEALAQEIGGRACAPDEVLTLDVDVVSPCAVGGAITAAVAGQVRAWAVCGAANNVLASAEAEDVLLHRGVLFVPDVLASCGAVIEGAGERLMGLQDRTPLIDQLRDTVGDVLRQALDTGTRASDIVRRRAKARIEAKATAHASSREERR